MADRDLIGHYGGDGLVATIDAVFERLGTCPECLTIDDLGPVDEFHIGGRAATHRLIDQLRFPGGAQLVDVGCGLGGTARLLASAVGAEVSGIDLCPGYVEAGRILNRRVGLADRIDLHVGTATDMPFDDASFDGGVMLHVGMNVADKPALLAEVARVLRPGAAFGIYDVMRVGEGELDHPLPWSSRPSTNHLAGLDDYRRAAEGAGLAVEAVTDRSVEARAALDRIRLALQSDGPPPLGLHLVMGPETPAKVANVARAVEAGIVAPIEVVLRR